MSLNLYITIAVWLLLMTVGQVLFKLAAENVDLVANGIIRSFVFNYYLVVAVAMYMVATLFWVWILKLMPLKQAYPLNALGFIIVPIFAYFIFKETLTLQYWIGVSLIVLGVLTINFSA